MLNIVQLQRVANRTRARDIANVEIEVVLTHMLQMLNDRGVFQHLAFKGGTMLRKMVFGQNGRLSTDLDFTRMSDISIDDLSMMLAEVFQEDYRGLSYEIDQTRDWYETADGCSVVPVVRHEGNTQGLKIKVQVSTREEPALPPVERIQLKQDYFAALDFDPVAVPCLRMEEVLAEKIRAASQRSKIRDLHDLCEILNVQFDRDLVRSLAVLKLWKSGGDGLDFERLKQQIEGGRDYDIEDLKRLLRRDQNPNLATMIREVTTRYRFLSDLTPLETKLATDRHKRNDADAAALLAALRAQHAPAAPKPEAPDSTSEFRLK